ncbi:MAG: hypothetical protein ACRC1J_05260, partial [Sandaracinobacteroides sp.]
MHQPRPGAITPFAFSPPPVAALEDGARILLKAARLWVMLARHNRNPRPVLQSLLGSGTAAFCALMDHVVTAWPDPFTCHPPCACALLPDEHCLLALLAFAEAGNEAGADALLEDLLPASERRR